MDNDSIRTNFSINIRLISIAKQMRVTAEVNVTDVIACLAYHLQQKNTNSIIYVNMPCITQQDSQSTVCPTIPFIKSINRGRYSLLVSPFSMY